MSLRRRVKPLNLLSPSSFNSPFECSLMYNIWTYRVSQFALSGGNWTQTGTVNLTEDMLNFSLNRVGKRVLSATGHGANTSWGYVTSFVRRRQTDFNLICSLNIITQHIQSIVTSSSFTIDTLIKSTISRQL